MVAGSLSSCGYYMGTQLVQPNPSNPKGFFEDREINSINEDLLDLIVLKRPPILGRWFFQDRPRRGAYWLATIPAGVKIVCPPEIAQRISACVSRAPFCFKDPRFSYTLPAWRPFLDNTVFLCVFREPAVTAASILKESKEPKYQKKVSLKFGHAIRLWTILYRQIFEIHRHTGQWLFLHYDQILQGNGINRLEEFLETQVDRNFPSAKLKRSTSNEVVATEAQELYEALCKLAGYVQNNEATILRG